MQTVEIEITNKEGIHSRPSSMISLLASKYPCCDVRLVTKDGRQADAKSTIEVIILGVIYKQRITVVASGEKESEVIENLSKLLKSNFKEEIK
ncbi:HPr family phosphocarrier protein [Borrelia sp. RT1S]|uniref:HPr family phosphocarrier protein n=1 Tax=Borrelia sp. RT1S TaxID=2898580 RepID=UPI001E282AE7|nr:HPr family phosphocarrier protein [Borrelia sp. RT1S]UGQ17241.1 HPr family phosphocarrier protein [Borrelia sp. RT1S]